MAIPHVGRESYVALLPTGCRINAKDPSKATYFNQDQTLVIWQLDDGRLVGATTFGEGPEVGKRAKIRHDQSLKVLSYDAVVVGTCRFADRLIKGEVPMRSLPHWVYK